MSNIINSQAYVKQGDKVYKVNGGAGSTIHTFNSVEDMNAANLADGSIACVPSSGGGGGLPVVEITTDITAGGGTDVELSADECAAFNIAAANGLPIVIKLTLGGMGMSFVCYCTDMGDAKVYTFETDMAKLQFTWTAESCVGGFESKA